MRRVEIHLKEEERGFLGNLSSTGVCWSLPLLTEVARCQTQALRTVSQATVRQVLKKTL